MILFLILYSVYMYEVPAHLSRKDVETIEVMQTREIIMRHVAACVRHEIRAVTSLFGKSGPGLLWIGKIINIFGNREKLQPFKWGTKLTSSYRFSDLKNSAFSISLKLSLNFWVAMGNWSWDNLLGSEPKSKCDTCLLWHIWCQVFLLMQKSPLRFH